MGSAMKIDWCISFDGERAKEFGFKFFNSLKQYSSLTDVTFHIVDRTYSVKEIIPEELLAITSFYKIPTFLELHGPDELDVAEYVLHDVALTCDWMIENCGTSEWVIISHFDIEFTGDVLSWFREAVGDKVGMIGEHLPIMMVRRKAYRQCWMKFNSFSYFFYVPINDGSNEGKIRYVSDIRCTDKSMPVRGFDNGEMLEINMQTRGWKFIPLDDKVKAQMVHFNGGSGWHNYDNFKKYRDICKNEHT